MNKKVSLVIATALTVTSLSFANTASAFQFFPQPNNGGYGGSNYSSVPELDAAGAPIALALVAGLAGLGIERRRRRKNKSDDES